jgi:uncharacterized membrane protein
MASSKARSKVRGQSTAGTPLATPTASAKPAGQARRAKPVTAETEPEFEESAPAAADEPSGPPVWLQYTTLVLAVLALAVSAYETYAHYTNSGLLGCPSTPNHGTFDCSAVITSPQSMVFGVIPVALLGLLFYAFVVAIMTPWAWRLQRREVAWLRLASMIVGMGFVMYLIYAEVYQIQEVCEYCTGVHILTFLLFCLTVFAAAIWGFAPGRLGRKSRRPRW